MGKNQIIFSEFDDNDQKILSYYVYWLLYMVITGHTEMHIHAHLNKSKYIDTVNNTTNTFGVF